MSGHIRKTGGKWFSWKRIIINLRVSYAVPKL
jgi:hypothetical protein